MRLRLVKISERRWKLYNSDKKVLYATIYPSKASALRKVAVLTRQQV